MKKHTQRLATGLTAAVAALALAACSSSSESADPIASSASSDEPKGAIAMGFATSEIQIWNDQLEIMRPIIEDAGYEFLTDDPQFDINRQVASWQAWVNRGDVKAIMGYPVSTDSVVPVTEVATEAGVPVLGYLLTWDGVAAATIVDSYEGGYDLGVSAAEETAETAGADATITVATFGGRDTEFGALAMDGLAEGFVSVMPNAVITELSTITREDGYNFTKSQLTADPDTHVWLGASNDTMLGAYQALLDSGVAVDDPDYYVASRDATNEVLDLIKIPDSIYRTSIVVPAQALAEANAKLLIDAAEGVAVTDITVPSVFVTAENADEFYVAE
ncbi:sugar ABC transporter substrate-binding protein [Demequina aurantiaca]|uniref:sugar ABC transporter substrate-binding protein n=1 Tax=Demequina aurantiaca TaxID=676200 RepID=UPI003D34C2ED